jgi:hypothetical protein
MNKKQDIALLEVKCKDDLTGFTVSDAEKEN